VFNGSLSKTAANGAAGANSQVSGLVAAVMTIVTLLVLTSLFEKLPEPTLAAIVIAAVLELVDIGALVRLYRIYTRRLGQAYGIAARPDFLAAIAALLGVTVFDTLPGLFIGIAVSLLLLLYRASRPRVTELVEVPGSAGRYADAGRIEHGGRTPGVTVLRVESGLFFANSDWVRDRVRAAAAQAGTKAVIIDASDVPFVDVTAVQMLDELADTLDSEGITLSVARDIDVVRDVVRLADSEHKRQRLYPSVAAAVRAAAGASGSAVADPHA
jgi:SulP family sulfate permease